MKRTNTNITDSLWFAILGGLVFVFLVALFAASTSTACGYMSDVPQPTQKPIAYKTTMSDDTTTYASLYADVYPTIDSTHLSFYDTTRVVKKPYESTDTSDVEAYIHKKIARSTLCRYYNDRFQYTLLFPSCFKAGPLPESNSGTDFAMGHDIKIVVFGSYSLLSFEEDLSKPTYYKLAKDQYRHIYQCHLYDRYYKIWGMPKTHYIGHEEVKNHSLESWEKTMFVMSDIDDDPGDGLMVTLIVEYPKKYRQAVMPLIKTMDRYMRCETLK
jgi:hypothetical protein